MREVMYGCLCRCADVYNQQQKIMRRLTSEKIDQILAELDKQ